MGFSSYSDVTDDSGKYCRWMVEIMTFSQSYAGWPCRFVPTNRKAGRKAAVYTAFITWHSRLTYLVVHTFVVLTSSSTRNACTNSSYFFRHIFHNFVHNYRIRVRIVLNPEYRPIERSWDSNQGLNLFHSLDERCVQERCGFLSFDRW